MRLADFVRSGIVDPVNRGIFIRIYDSSFLAGENAKIELVGGAVGLLEGARERVGFA